MPKKPVSLKLPEPLLNRLNKLFDNRNQAIERFIREGLKNHKKKYIR